MNSKIFEENDTKHKKLPYQLILNLDKVMVLFDLVSKFWDTEIQVFEDDCSSWVDCGSSLLNDTIHFLLKTKTIITIALLLVTFTGLRFFSSYSKIKGKLLPNIPSPEMEHLMGHLSFMLSPQKHILRQECCNNSISTIHQFTVLQNCSVFVNCPNTAAEVLQNVHDKGDTYESYRFDPLVPDLLTSNTEDHKLRIPISDAINRLDINEEKITSDLIPVVVNAAEKGLELDMRRLFSLLALDIIVEAAFGYALGATASMSTSSEAHSSSSNIIHSEGEKLLDALEILAKRQAALSLFGQGLHHDEHAVSPEEELRAKSIYTNFIEKMLNIVKTNVESNKCNENFSYSLVNWANSKFPDHHSGFQPGGKYHRLEIIDNKTDKDRIRDLFISAEIHQLLRHSTEALSGQLQWMIVCLHRHTRSRMLLENALKNTRVISPNENEICLNNKQFNNAMLPEYAECFIKEVLRKYPVCGNSTVRTTKSSKSFVGGYNIPSNIPLHCHMFSLHNSKQIWDCPNEFLPERWIIHHNQSDTSLQAPPSCPFQSDKNHIGVSFYDGVGHKDNSLSFFPFSSGNRKCSGKSLSLKVMRRVLCVLATGFRFEPAMHIYGTNSDGTNDSLVTGNDESAETDYLYDEPGTCTTTDLIIPLFKRSTTVSVKQIRYSELGNDWKMLQKENLGLFWADACSDEDEEGGPECNKQAKSEEKWDENE